ncbi:cytochrome c biogenesis protein CcsA [Alcaligenaceae bacterium A4P071]|nr:cytochrome c biogenesis protein CcsA [Alcaligenaceae bacterium B3P038]MDQ2151076.1 cytochrome c biogenesis protein CcsA [Alcaligenaceae bacterium C4P045]MDQ2187568.1 cytochrome c biogenesis protein CcsA [Alcaligenaceae bacterium A4P071]
MSLGIVFHAAAAVAYALLAAGLWVRLTRGDTIAQSGKIGRAGLLIALVLHGAGLYEAALAQGTLFIGWASALSAAVWLGLVVYWLESLVVRIDGLQLLLLPAATAVTLLAALFPQGVVVVHGDNVWLRTHLIIALSAYGLITIAALQASLMALLDRRLHRPQEDMSQRTIVGRVLDAQPPLLEQERLLFRLIWVGFVVLTLAVFSGSYTSMMLTGKVLPFDHKTVFTLLSWLTFGILLLGRHIWGWRGRVALRWTLTGFALLILAYTGSRFVLEVILHRS